MRKTPKSKLAEFIIFDNNNFIRNEKVPDKCTSVYAFEMMTQITSCINNVTDTFQQFIESFLSLVPKNYVRVHLITDKYRNISIKSKERENRVASSKILIGFTKGKIEKYLSNNENKIQLIHLIFKNI